jgi:hypothetical protein
MKDVLQKILPKPTLKRRVVTRRQEVPEIMREVLRGHRDYASQYDLIAGKFWKGSAVRTARALFDFCKENLKYKIESEQDQTVRSPGAILATGDTWGVDCKHYASFIGGVLDALNRAGHNIDWCYKFVSYTPGDSTPEHVFIEVRSGGRAYYVDPVLSQFDLREPKFYYFHDKFPKPMLSRVSGIEAERAEYGGGGPGGGSGAAVVTQPVYYAAPTAAPQENSSIAPGAPIVTATDSGVAAQQDSVIKKYWWIFLLVVVGGAYYMTKTVKK